MSTVLTFMRQPAARFICAVTLGVFAAALSAASATAQQAPATRPALPPAQPLPGAKMAADLEYGHADGKPLLLDLYVPLKEVTGKLPLVVWVHGGGWSAGSRRNPPALPLLKHGFAVASVEYRLSQEAKFPAQIEDCKAALRWLRANADMYHLDPDHVGVWGSSAGGHLVAMLGATGGVTELDGANKDNADQSSKVQAVCDWFGPTDLTQFTAEATANGHPPGRFDSYIMRAFLGGDPATHMDLVTLANPLHFLPAGRAVDVPPFLIMHGDRDRTVPIAQSRLLADALVHGGVPTTFRVVVGLGHGFPTGREDIGPVTLNFFERTLGRPTAQPW